MKHLQLNEELQERAILYAAGALDEKERRDYARHLEEDDCAICLAEVRECEAAAQSLVMNLPLQTPSASVKQRLLAQAEASASTARAKPENKRSLFGIIGVTGWATAVAMTIAFFWISYTNDKLRTQVTTLVSRVIELQDRVGAQQTKLAKLTTPDMRLISLAGQKLAPEARAIIFWNEKERTWQVYVRGLPPAQANRSYQLWFVPKAGKPPVSAQVFDTKADGTAELDITVPPNVTDLMLAAVTDEPAGGQPQPTGGFVLLGSTE
jgi:anti-sigma-K factor RskA